MLYTTSALDSGAKRTSGEDRGSTIDRGRERRMIKDAASCNGADVEEFFRYFFDMNRQCFATPNRRFES
jgi:hypothetical protein